MSDRPQKRRRAKRGPLRTVYQREILPLVEQVVVLCKEHGIDHVVAFILDDEGPSYGMAGHAYVVREGLEDLKVAAEILRGQALVLPVDAVDLEPPPGIGRA